MHGFMRRRSSRKPSVDFHGHSDGRTKGLHLFLGHLAREPCPYEAVDRAGRPADGGWYAGLDQSLSIPLSVIAQGIIARPSICMPAAGSKDRAPASERHKNRLNPTRLGDRRANSTCSQRGTGKDPPCWRYNCWCRSRYRGSERSSIDILSSDHTWSRAIMVQAAVRAPPALSPPTVMRELSMPKRSAFSATQDNAK